MAKTGDSETVNSTSTDYTCSSTFFGTPGASTPTSLNPPDAILVRLLEMAASSP